MKRKPFLILSTALVVSLLFVLGAASAQAMIPARPVAAVSSFIIPDFLGTYYSSEASDVVVDGEGGIHVVLEPGFFEDDPLYYMTCSNSCDNLDNWTSLGIGDLGTYGGDARIKVDTQGNLHVMYYYYEIGQADQAGYYYKVCWDGDDCTQLSNWHGGLVKLSSSGPDETTQSLNSTVNYFTLDPQGHPYLIYEDRYAFDDETHRGAWMAYCDQPDCSNAASWLEYKLHDTADVINRYELAFAGSGQPRILYEDDAWDDDSYDLMYTQCDSNCDQPAQWSSTKLAAIGDDAEYAMAIDSQGRPRIAFYYGNLDGEDPQDDLLSYWWCNSGCATSANWQHYNLFTEPLRGRWVDLALDAQDRPHLAYSDERAQGEEQPRIKHLEHAVCSATCNSPAAWQLQVLDTDEDAEADMHIDLREGCLVSAWIDIGQYPALALTAAGQPVVSSNARHTNSGLYPPMGCGINYDAEFARISMVDDSVPPTLGSGTPGGGTPTAGTPGGSTPTATQKPPVDTNPIFLPSLSR